MMATADPNFLLKALQPAVQPAYLKGPAARPQTPVEGRSFENLLREAGSGAIDSGRAVAQGPATGAELEPRQLERLAAVADLAEASGARRALVMIDGRGLVLDVAGRRLTEELGGANRMASVDTAMVVPDEDDTPDIRIGPPGGVAPKGAADEIARARVPQGPRS
jgi:hypothetical protein